MWKTASWSSRTQKQESSSTHKLSLLAIVLVGWVEHDQRHRSSSYNRLKTPTRTANNVPTKRRTVNDSYPFIITHSLARSLSRTIVVRTSRRPPSLSQSASLRPLLSPSAFRTHSLRPQTASALTIASYVHSHSSLVCWISSDFWYASIAFSWSPFSNKILPKSVEFVADGSSSSDRVIATTASSKLSSA